MHPTIMNKRGKQQRDPDAASSGNYDSLVRAEWKTAQQSITRTKRTPAQTALVIKLARLVRSRLMPANQLITVKTRPKPFFAFFSPHPSPIFRGQHADHTISSCAIESPSHSVHPPSTSLLIDDDLSVLPCGALNRMVWVLHPQSGRSSSRSGRVRAERTGRRGQGFWCHCLERFVSDVRVFL
jgi:hypothetical protein